MSRSAGPGSPLTFWCSKARSTLVPHYMKVTHIVTPTGRTKPRPANGHALGVRSTTTLREYHCACGHVGWSNHYELELMAKSGVA